MPFLLDKPPPKDGSAKVLGGGWVVEGESKKGIEMAHTICFDEDQCYVNFSSAAGEGAIEKKEQRWHKYYVNVSLAQRPTFYLYMSLYMSIINATYDNVHDAPIYPFMTKKKGYSH